MKRGDAFAESAALFLLGPVDDGMLDLRPSFVSQIRLPLTARDADGLVPAANEARNEIRTDVTGAANDED